MRASVDADGPYGVRMTSRPGRGGGSHGGGCGGDLLDNPPAASSELLPLDEVPTPEMVQGLQEQYANQLALAALLTTRLEEMAVRVGWCMCLVRCRAAGGVLWQGQGFRVCPCTARVWPRAPIAAAGSASATTMACVRRRRRCASWFSQRCTPGRLARTSPQLPGQCRPWTAPPSCPECCSSWRPCRATPEGGPWPPRCMRGRHRHRRHRWPAAQRQPWTQPTGQQLWARWQVLPAGAVWARKDQEEKEQVMRKAACALTPTTPHRTSGSAAVAGSRCQLALPRTAQPKQQQPPPRPRPGTASSSCSSLGR